MTTGVVPRLVDRAAAAVLAALGAATFVETYAGLLPAPAMARHCARHHSAAAWREILAQPGSACWLAEAADGAPVGYALLTAPNLPGAGAGDAELRRIYLLARGQGGGIGAALLDVALREARARTARRLVLGVWERNTAALGFYRRQGFFPIATRRFRVGDIVCDDLVLAREIDLDPPPRAKPPVAGR